MKAFLVLCVVGLLAAAEARFIFEMPHESAGLEQSLADIDLLKVAELLETADDDTQSQRFDSLGSDYKDIVVRCVNVDDPVSGIKGRLCLLVVYTSKTFFTALFLDSKNFYGSYVTPDILDELFGEGFCVRGKATKSHTVCFEIYGNRSLSDRTITARAILIRDDKVIADFGWFKVIPSWAANVDAALKASFPEVDESQKEFDVEVERLRIRARMPMNAILFPTGDKRL